jgi:acyl-CoA synthetase (AMP-forming)/AMP-acid ligase II
LVDLRYCEIALSNSCWPRDVGRIDVTSISEALGRLWQAGDDAKLLQQNGAWVSWGRVRQLAEQLDAQLDAAGCGAGGRVAVVLGNRMESVAALIAIMRGERTLVTISPLQPVERLSSDLAASGAAFVLSPAAMFDEEQFTAALGEIGAAAWSVEEGALLQRCDLKAEPKTNDTGAAVEMLTSGTTGAPKRIPLSRRQLEASLSSALQHNDRPDGSEREPLTGTVGFVVVPIVHIGGLWGLLQSLVTARPFVLLERFSLPAWRAAVAEHRPGMVSLPPPAIRAVFDSDISAEELSSVRAVTAGTSAVEPALVDAFYERFGIPILAVYGATEFSGAVAGWTKKDFLASWTDKKGSVGKAFPGVRLQVVDDDGKVVPTGVVGRLQVSTPQAGDTVDGWVTTSDLAHIDQDGYLYIDGRADDVIVRGGFKVAPDAVIRALRSHQAVKDAAVAGLPDPRLGQVPIAAVELRPEAVVDPQELREHCRSSLTPYEVPAEVHVIDELPRGAALKVDRQRLIAILEQKRAGDPA